VLTLTWAVFIAAVASAFLHACWNVLAKLHSAPRDLLRGIVFATASLCCVLLPFVGVPPSGSWLWVAAARRVESFRGATVRWRARNP